MKYFEQKGPVFIKDRAGNIIQENAPGEFAIRLGYNTGIIGKSIVNRFFKTIKAAENNAKKHDRLATQREKEKFISFMGINMDEAEYSIDDYEATSQIFTRKLKPNARPIDTNTENLVFPADGRVLAWESVRNVILDVKGVQLTIEQLLNNTKEAKKYENGTVISVRLAPEDYHRYHFPYDGIPTKKKRIAGDLYSVSPIAMRNMPNIWGKNKREYIRLKTDSIGDIGIVNVGATYVGSMVTTHIPEQPVKKGDEHGYFKIGGSQMVLLFEPGKIKIDQDILQNTQEGFETISRMGQKFAEREK